MNTTTEPKTLRGKAELPAFLPTDPAAAKYRRRMSLHMKVQGGGIMVYTVTDEFGNMLPIVQRATTVKGQKSGFLLPESDEPMTWRELVAAWPAFYEKQP